MNLRHGDPVAPRPIGVAMLLCVAGLSLAAEFHGWTGQTGQGPYLGQEPPGTTPKIFAPGIVSTAAHEFSCSFTPDGKEFYFTRRDPIRGVNLILITKEIDGTWTKPEVVPFIQNRMSFEPRVTPDGSRLYFTWEQPFPDQEGSPMGVWYVQRKGRGWSNPIDPGRFLNPMKAMYVSSTLDGTIYTSDISRGPGKEGIAVARLVDGNYRKLEQLPAPINVGAQDMYPYIAPDESYLIFASRRQSPPSTSGLFVSFRKADGTWVEPRAIDLGVPAGLPLVSPDGKYLFFTAGERGKSDIYWVDARFLGEWKQTSPRPPQDHFVVPDVTARKTERMIDVGGRKLHVSLYGQGSPTIVLASGFNQAPQQTWNPLIDPLAAEATVITYDRAGIGKSEIGDLPTHARQSAVDVHRLLEQLNTPKPVLFVGHSYGVRVVKLYASLFPSEVGGMVLMDGVPATILDAQKAILTGADLERLEQMTAGATAPPNPRTEMDYSLESLEQERRMGPLPRVPTLVLVAGANREQGVPPGFSPEARRKMAQVGLDLQKKMATDLGGRFIVFDDLGHNMHLEKPGPIVLAIKEMIQQLRAAPGRAQ
jgi:pimeloyl-ACP methyl ester carboxylesterase